MSDHESNEPIVPLQFQLDAVTILANIRGEKIKEHQAEIERLRDLLKRARGFVRIVGQQVSDRAILESEIDAALQKPVEGKL